MESPRIVAVAALGLILAYGAAAAGDGEDELKAAVVLSFLRYTAWPAAPGDNTISVGVLGRDALLHTLHTALAGKSVNNRLVRVADGRTDPGCPQVFYIASEKAGEIQKGLQAARSCHALTIGESDRFLELGGAVNLLVVDGKMRFEVDLAAVERSGIEISSTLLRYGQVRGRPPA